MSVTLKADDGDDNVRHRHCTILDLQNFIVFCERFINRPIIHNRRWRARIELFCFFQVFSVSWLILLANDSHVSNRDSLKKNLYDHGQAY